MKVLSQTAIVGNETETGALGLTISELIVWMDYVRDQVSVPVTTAETWGVLEANPELIEASDIIYMNSYAYWQGVDIQCSIYEFNQSYKRIKAVANGKQIVISEVGHPRVGRTFGASVPSPDNQLLFLNHIRQWQAHTDINVFWFMLTSAPWKFPVEQVEWGLSAWSDSTQTIRFYPRAINELQTPITDIDTSFWSCKHIPSPTGEPRIVLDCPPYTEPYGISGGAITGRGRGSKHLPY